MDRLPMEKIKQPWRSLVSCLSAHVKKAAYVLLACAWLAACTDEAPTTPNPTDRSATSAAEVAQSVPVVSAYAPPDLAYLVEGELFFFSLADNKKINFAEESEAIFNFTFDSTGQTLYYSVERDNTLWLKSADLNAAVVTPQWLVDWQLHKDECVTQTFGEASPLLYHQGELLLEHGFSWQSYGFESMLRYSLATQRLQQTEYDGSILQPTSGQITSEFAEQHFTTAQQQLYYTANDVTVCLTDSLALDTDAEQGGEAEFVGMMLSPDTRKVMFAAILGWGDLLHGPYIIANADGSQQMLLEQTDFASSMTPVWLSDNSVAFVDSEQTLFIANNDAQTIKRVASHVAAYSAPAQAK